MLSLAAEPLYSLIDTAFIGHLGTTQLGAVAVGTAAFSASFWIFSFLAYGVTARVARAFGGSNRSLAADLGVQALFLAVTLGVLVSLIGLAFADPVVRVLGAEGRIASLAAPYLRIRILSAAPVLVAQVGHGWLRGAQDTRTPMTVATVGVAINILLDYALIFPAGLGVAGAALSHVIGQSAIGLAFVYILSRRFGHVRWRFDLAVARSLGRVGVDLIVRTGALLAGLTIATSVAARMGVVQLGSWQIVMQVFLLLALSMDAVAIAGQALVGTHLGAGGYDQAREIGVRSIVWGAVIGSALLVALVGLRQWVGMLFSDDQRVIVAAAGLIAWVGLIQPLASVAFALDGILIGASDTRFLAVAMVGCSAVFIAISLLSLHNGWGTAGLAAGATIWIAGRVATTGWRFVGTRWLTQG